MPRVWFNVQLVSHEAETPALIDYGIAPHAGGAIIVIVARDGGAVCVVLDAAETATDAKTKFRVAPLVSGTVRIVVAECSGAVCVVLESRHALVVL